MRRSPARHGSGSLQDGCRGGLASPIASIRVGGGASASFGRVCASQPVDQAPVRDLACEQCTFPSTTVESILTALVRNPSRVGPWRSHTPPQLVDHLVTHSARQFAWRRLVRHSLPQRDQDRTSADESSPTPRDRCPHAPARAMLDRAVSSRSSAPDPPAAPAHRTATLRPPTRLGLVSADRVAWRSGAAAHGRPAISMVTFVRLTTRPVSRTFHNLLDQETCDLQESSK